MGCDGLPACSRRGPPGCRRGSRAISESRPGQGDPHNGSSSDSRNEAYTKMSDKKPVLEYGVRCARRQVHIDEPLPGLHLELEG
jgi:hypothetical protein